VLAHLSRNEGIKQAGLAEILEIKPITLARLLDRLSANGWVERRSDPNDKRARLLFLTNKARPILVELRSVALSVREEALSGLDAAEQDRLIDQLRVVKENLVSADKRADRDLAVDSKRKF
jgi:DNA-binding MarR family transcriptional regulator